MFDPETFHSMHLEMCRKSLWAGFAPLEIPLLIWNGTHTYAFHHPNPPAPFEPEWDWYVMEGRAETIVANSTGTLDFLPVATVMAVDLDSHATAILAIHEAFHIFQNAQYPRWSANELEVLRYPMLDIDALALRRLETRALSKAIALQDLGWVRAALKARASRFAKLEERHRVFERELERIEGTAFFVEGRVQNDTFTLPEEDFAPEEVRARAYLIGRAWMELLTRFGAQSVRELGKEYIDVLLKPIAKNAIERPLTFSILEFERERARQDIENLILQRSQKRNEFFNGEGFLLEINSPTPLQPQGFDPMNLETLETNEVLHNRYLRLGDQRGSLEVQNVQTLTIGTEHPFLINTLYVKLPNAPSVNRAAVLRVQHENLKFEWENAQLELLDRAMRISLP
jgi:hypothetical protein